MREGEFFIKRVIGIGGDSIQGKNNVVFVNGQAADEPYVEHTGQPAEEWLTNFGPITVPNGTYFVLGDNRDFSFDSRASNFGLVNHRTIAGKPLYVLASGRTGKSLR
jgi:signal peptidase I